jgi:hypothetical protein
MMPETLEILEQAEGDVVAPCCPSESSAAAGPAPAVTVPGLLPEVPASLAAHDLELLCGCET